MYKIAVILLICILFLFNSIEENSDTMFLEGFNMPTIQVPTVPTIQVPTVPTIQVPTVPTIQVPTVPPTAPSNPDGYSSNDVVFTPAPQTGEVTVQTDVSKSFTNIDESKQNYKNKMNELNTIKKSFGLTKKQNADFNISQNALILNNVTLGIGILGMMWVVYN